VDYWSTDFKSRLVRHAWMSVGTPRSGDGYDRPVRKEDVTEKDDAQLLAAPSRNRALLVVASQLDAANRAVFAAQTHMIGLSCETPWMNLPA